MVTNFDYLKKEPKFSVFADAAVSAEKNHFTRPGGQYFEQPAGDGVCGEMDVFCG